MSDETELARAVSAQAAALERANQLKATELAYNGHERSRSNKINTMIQALQMAIKLKADRPVDDAIADAEKIIDWFGKGTRVEAEGEKPYEAA